MATTGGARPQTRTSSRYIDSLYGIRPTTSTKGTATRNTAPSTYVNPTTQLRQASVTPQATAPRVAASTGGGANTAPSSSLQWTGSNATGGGAGTVPFTGDKGTGWNAKYLPEYWQTVLNDPSILGTDVLKTMGIRSPGLANDLGDQAQLAALLGFIQNPNEDYTMNAQINYMGDYLKQLMTPGGRTPNTDDLVDTILGLRSGGNNPLYDYLMHGNNGEALTPDQQYSRVNNALEAAYSGMSPYMQMAMQGMLEDAQHNYAGKLAHGTQGGANDYISYLRGLGLGAYR